MEKRRVWTSLALAAWQGVERCLWSFDVLVRWECNGWRDEITDEDEDEQMGHRQEYYWE
jgi:hypothetical protein